MTDPAFSRLLDARISEINAAGLLRTLRQIDSPQSIVVESGGSKLRNFSSNDYLGLASHPTVVAAAVEAVSQWGAGTGASRLISGNLACHEALENELAAFKLSPSALTFSSGYAAALGVIPALVGRGDTVILDKLSHACLVDGARLSGATLRVFPHNNLDVLESRLQWAGRNGGKTLVVVESVYSMDGDLAPLKEIVTLKEHYGAWLLLDEAHGLGVIGSSGRGLAVREGVADRVEIQMGTLGKALGSAGAYVCGEPKLRDLLINSARSFVFSTAPPPAAIGAARAGIAMLTDPQTGPPLVARLHKNISQFTALLDREAAPSAILPIIIGHERDAMDAMHRLLTQGLIVPAVRYPTVPRGQARLRISLSAAHTVKSLEHLARQIRQISRS